MRIGERHWRTLWELPDRTAVEIIDQRLLPHRLATLQLRSAADAVAAIADMAVRGAPLIGVTAAYGLALQARADAGDEALERAARLLKHARPTAVNLAWAVDHVMKRLRERPPEQRAEAAWAAAAALAQADVDTNQAIGQHGLALLQALCQNKGGTQRLNLLTHCNAGWLATVDIGTALAPIYAAAAAGLDVHVWVDETRPRNQGASLTAYELREQGIAHTVIADNAGGHLMQGGRVDAVLVGCDRVSARGDVCNKIGTYLKALAARDNGVPFYVAMPVSTLDIALSGKPGDFAIEERSARELTHVWGIDEHGQTREVRLVPHGCAAANPAFDVTPARLVTALITEYGVVPATAEALGSLPRAGMTVNALGRA